MINTKKRYCFKLNELQFKTFVINKPQLSYYSYYYVKVKYTNINTLYPVVKKIELDAYAYDFDCDYYYCIDFDSYEDYVKYTYMLIEKPDEPNVSLRVSLRDSIAELLKIKEEKSEMETNINFKTINKNNNIYSSCVYLDEFLNDYTATPKFDLKDIKISGPATIAFWTDGSKTVVKCQKADQYDAEKGIIMAVCKGLLLKYNSNKDWAKIFDIPYLDEIDVEKVIGLHVLKTYMEHEGNKEWHYNYVLKYLYKSKNYTVKDEVNALKALGYSEYRIKKCLNITDKELRDALGQGLVYKKEQKIPVIAKNNKDNYIDRISTSSGDEYKFTVNKEETKKIIDEICKEDELRAKVVKMFNEGYNISKIAKVLHISVYFVEKYLDQSTDPKFEEPKKNKAKKSIKNKKEVKTKRAYHKYTSIEYPSWLTKNECDKILEEAKTKYDGQYKNLSTLQYFFMRECKKYKIKQCYGNGYTMYEIADIIGSNASVVNRIWNQIKAEEVKTME